MQALAQAAAADPFSPLLQVGVTGAVLVITLLALRAVYQQQIRQLEETVRAERERAAKAENALNSLNADVRDRLLTSMSGSADAFRDALRALEGRR
jgi:hypothetical protein